MSGKGGSSGGGGVIVQGQKLEKPKGLLDAIMDIQQFASIEKDTVYDFYDRAKAHVEREMQRNPNLNKQEEFEKRLRLLMRDEAEFFSTKQRLEFFEVGFRGSFLSGMLTAFLAPLAIGVVENNIPAFGDAVPTAFDKAFVFMLALAFTLGYSIFIAQVGRYYGGIFTGPMIRNFYGGVITGSFLKAFIVFILFHFIYLKVLQDKYIVAVILFLHPLLSDQQALATYQWVVDFKPVFITSAWFVVATTVIFAAIPIGASIAGVARKKREFSID